MRRIASIVFSMQIISMASTSPVPLIPAAAPWPPASLMVSPPTRPSISPRWIPLRTASWVARPLILNSSSLWDPTNATSAPDASRALQDDASKLPAAEVATII